MTSENFPSSDPTADRTPDSSQSPEERPLLNLGNSRPPSSSVDPRLSQFEAPEANPFVPDLGNPGVQSDGRAMGASRSSAEAGRIDLDDLEHDGDTDGFPGQGAGQFGGGTQPRDGAQPHGDDPWADAPPGSGSAEPIDRAAPLGEFNYNPATEGFPLEAAAFSMMQGHGSPRSSESMASASAGSGESLGPEPSLTSASDAAAPPRPDPLDDDPWADPVEDPVNDSAQPTPPPSIAVSGHPDPLSSESGETGETDAPQPRAASSSAAVSPGATEQGNRSEVVPETQPGSETTTPATHAAASNAAAPDPELDRLQSRRSQLQGDVERLEEELRLIQEELVEAKQALSTMIREASRELLERRQALKLSIEQLEQRQEKIQEEMKQNFAGASQELAVRVQSFKNFLVGSLQDLVVAADDLKLVPEAPEVPVASGPAQADGAGKDKKGTGDGQARTPRFAEQSFAEEAQEIRQLLDQYRTSPDYYGPPWQLRRTFEPIHADRVANWFFRQGGRGAIRSLGGRTQNILVASAVISILNYFYGEQLSALILANNPERLGDWRRGLQDCLGIARSDFGPNRGIALFEDPLPLAQRADRILRSGNLPLIIIDESESVIDLSVLQFPIWLAFAVDPADRRSQSQDYF